MRPILLLLLLLMGGSAFARPTTTGPAATAPSPADAPAYAGPATQPADFPQQLVHQILGEIGRAKNLSVTINRQEEMVLVEKPKKASHETLNTIQDTTQQVALHRPGDLKFQVMSVSPINRAPSAATALLTGSKLWIVYPAKRAGHPRGTVGDMENKTVDEIMRSSSGLMWMYSDAASRVLQSDAAEIFAASAFDWKWLGMQRDNGLPIWRVGFKTNEPGGQVRQWEWSITQSQPHRLIRIRMRQIITTAITELRPGATFSPTEGIDSTGSVETDYHATQSTNVRFSGWDLTGPLPAGTFAPPEGNFKETVYPETQIKLPVGSVTQLSALRSLDGQEVDLSKREGPVVLDFWFSACGPCLYWMPKVEKLVASFADKGVKLYAINGIDSPQLIRKTIAQQGWRKITPLLDEKNRYTLQFDISAYPTVIVIDRAGKILYRDFPGAEDSMFRLEKALRSATGRTAATTAQDPAPAPAQRAR